MPISTIIKKVISRYGQYIIRKPRKVTEDRGYYYGEQEVIRGQVSQLTGYTESWEAPGMVIRADFLITFPPDVTVDKGDLLKINDEWVEVVEVLKRRTGNRIDFIECLCRRRTE